MFLFSIDIFNSNHTKNTKVLLQNYILKYKSLEYDNNNIILYLIYYIYQPILYSNIAIYPS